MNTDKGLLDQYIDACELIRETEMEILRLEGMQTEQVQDFVRGSNPNYPYEERRFKVEGVEFTSYDSAKLHKEKRILEQRRQQAEEIRVEVEEWMNTLPLRMQRIIRYHFFNGYTWRETARRMGRRSTADSVRMEFNKFFGGDEK